MDSQEFLKQLNEVQELVKQENYKGALILIEKLKKIEKNSTFDYNITHRLYQLDSNTHSLYNQQLILKTIKNLSEIYNTISFNELNQAIKQKSELELSTDILRREVEILILRNLISCRIDGEKLIF
ncbi:MAG: hypothetical protein JSV23_01710 [Promethearchaeota archaeon]|nr:MAG: hypothetical protein JSV23_01710 [Candidatus Lokiarchaeota archaeon]